MALAQAISFHTNYTGIFPFVAENENVPLDKDSVFKLAADSCVDRSFVEGVGNVMVIEANHYGDKGYNMVRGAQLNGRHYALLIGDDSFRLVGVLHGREFRWQNVGDERRLVSSWHMSADDNPETTYTWDGRVFAPFALNVE